MQKQVVFKEQVLWRRCHARQFAYLTQSSQAAHQRMRSLLYVGEMWGSGIKMLSQGIPWFQSWFILWFLFSMVQSHLNFN